MSMTVLTICQIAGVLAAYTLATILLPYLLLRKRLAGYSAAEQLTGYFLIGNFYVIYLVFLLQFLHISHPVTLIIGTIMPFLLCRWKKRKGHIIEDIYYVLSLILKLLRKEIGLKTILSKLKGRLGPCFAGLGGRIRKYAPDIILTALITAGVFYIYGTNIVTVFGYKASDIPVHNLWINEMNQNDLFSQGVYPHGFHCVLYYLHAVFGIKTYTLLRVFALVQTLFMHLVLVLSLKLICKSKFTPYIGTAIYLMVEMSADLPFSRFLSTLPQEFGMLFIFPAGVLAIRFFQEYAAMLTENDQMAKAERKRKVMDYLIGFAISFSLTLTVHFYDTMPAGILCVGIAIGFCFRFVRWKYFWRIMLTGVISVMLAVIPMAMGVATGHHLQGSLYWGLNVINGTANGSTQKSTIIVDKNGNEIQIIGDIDDETLEKLINGDYTDSDETSEDISKEDISKEEKVQQSISDKVKEAFNNIAELLKRKAVTILNQMQAYCTNASRKVALVMLGCIMSLLVLGVLCLIARKKDYAGVLLSVWAYMILMCVFLSMKSLGLPELMQPSRVCIFFCYSMPLVWALAVDAVLYILFGWIEKKVIMNFAAVFVMLFGVFVTVSEDRIREPIQANGLETNEAITCLENIINGHDDFSWTILSANDERQMLIDYGYHYEMITFLRELKDIKKNKEITIPTEYVYFFIEKQPINYAGSANGLVLEAVSEEGASMPINTEDGVAAYQTDARWGTMSHMYYWALEFQKLHPDDMQVYYETDEFICYRLHQNVECLYNLSIDYGYNNP